MDSRGAASVSTDPDPGPPRQQRSIDTRAAILDAAVRALIEYGYAGTTTVRIQELAGATRGRLLHHFPSRDELLIAAVVHLAEARVTSVGQRERWPGRLPARVDAAVAAMWLNYQEPYFWAAMELWLAGRHHEQLRRALLPLERRVGRLMADSTDRFFGERLVARPGYREVRDLLTTSMRGVMLTYALDPRDPTTDPHLAAWRRQARRLLLPARVAPAAAP